MADQIVSNKDIVSPKEATPAVSTKTDVKPNETPAQPNPSENKDNLINLSPAQLAALQDSVRKEIRDKYIGTLSKKSKEVEDLRNQLAESKKSKDAPTWDDIDKVAQLRQAESEARKDAESNINDFFSKNPEIAEHKDKFDEIRSNFPDMNLDYVRKLVLAEVDPSKLIKQDDAPGGTKVHLSGSPKIGNSPSKNKVPTSDELKSATSIQDSLAYFQKLMGGE